MGIKSSGSYLGSTGINPYGSGGASFSGILDDYPTTAPAFSVDLLDSTYTDPIIELRRSSDNATKDFYPDSNNTFSMSSEDGSGTSVSTWVGAGDAFVRTWYDQSAGKDAQQTTTTNQPQIISSGTLNTIGTKAAIDFLSGTQTWLEIPTSTSTFIFLMDGTDSLISQVLETNSDVAGFQVLWSNNSTGGTDVGADLFILSAQWYQYGRNAVAANRFQNIGGVPVVNTHYITGLTWDMDNGTAANKGELYVNGGSAIANNTRATATTGSASTNNMRIGNSGSGTVGFKGNAQELIFWNNLPSRTGVRDNQNTRFTVY